MEDELARDSGLTDGFHFGSTSPAPCRNSTPGLAQVFTLILAPVPASASVLPSFDELFKQFMKAYLESNQGPRQPQVKGKQSFKAKVLDMYYGKLYIDCYHFSQQCKDHFKTAEATKANRTFLWFFFSV